MQGIQSRPDRDRMSDLKLSVIVPTRDRPNRLRETLSGLTQQQDLDSRDYEVIVVDDGLVPASVNETANAPVAHLIRLGGAGRSAARNHGAGTAQGELLVFVDDDMKVSRTFLSSHLKAHRESPGALQVGSIRLPD